MTPRGPILVLGFGPFLDVVDNPAASLARAVDGADVGAPVVGRVMSVSYDRALVETLRLVEEHQPRVVVGVGVATGRSEVCVEEVGRKLPGAGLLDVDGQPWRLSAAEVAAPARLPASLPSEPFAAALGARLSQDAGTYVCNAWLYRVALALDGQRAVGFVHVPATGLAPDRFLQGLRTLIAPGQSLA